MEITNESIGAYTTQGLKQSTLCLDYALYSSTAHVLGSSKNSVKWNSGTLHEEWFQQPPDARTDTDRERGGSPGFEKYPRALPAMCFLSKTAFVLSLSSIFPIKPKWCWLWGRGAQSGWNISKLLAAPFKLQYKQTLRGSAPHFGPHTT